MPSFQSGLPLELPLLVAVVAGCFSLLGVFAGAWVTRRTERDKWLRQERSAAFAEFLRQLHSVRKQSLDIIHTTDLSRGERDMKVTELFVDLNSQENIVRLYLSEGDRERFSKLKHELWVLHNPTDDQARRIKKVEGVLSEIQSLFERTIGG